MASEFTIVLKKVGSITRFVNKMCSIHGSAMLVSPRCRINAKSLLGVMNTDKGMPITLELKGCTEDELALLMPDIKRWAPDTE